MKLYRIASSRHPVWSGMGAAIMGGRWNKPGQTVIYTALSYAGAMLEILVHTNNGKVPPSHRCVIAQVPKDIKVTRYSAEELPEGWDRQESSVAQGIGDQWFSEGKTAILIVPSVVARLEFNALVNPAHKDASRLIVSEEKAVLWDTRLFPKRGSVDV